MTLAIYAQDKDSEKLLNRSQKKDRLFAVLISTFGLLSILFATFPILSWYVTGEGLIASKVDKAPIPQGQVLSANTISTNVQVVENPDGFSYFSTNYKPRGNRPKDFKLSISKFKIDKAIVKVDTLNFYDNLSHFPGSALPGEVGNVFITGHSILPQFFDPKNYRGIFSKLPELEVGDVIDVEFGKENYRYVVQYKKVVNPKDLSVLLPITKNSKNLTLMTCVPPGTSIKRMVVVTTLI